MKITINGTVCECEKGEFILQIARRNGIEIPALCYHDGFPGQGSCRVCIVEAVEKGRGRIVVSCVYPVERECEIYTDNEKVRRLRGMTLALLQKKAPDSPEIRALCEKYGIKVKKICVKDASRRTTKANASCVGCVSKHAGNCPLAPYPL